MFGEGGGAEDAAGELMCLEDEGGGEGGGAWGACLGRKGSEFDVFSGRRARRRRRRRRSSRRERRGLCLMCLRAEARAEEVAFGSMAA